MDDLHSRVEEMPTTMFCVAAFSILWLCAIDSHALSLFGGQRTKRKMEQTVRRYFQGVNDKDPEMIRSCFGTTATIRDVCGINDSKRTVPAKDLVDRCVDFLSAHPDTVVDFYYVSSTGIWTYRV